MGQTHAESGTVVVENPHTGEILALANRPTFNPDDPAHITGKMLINHAVSNAYEPGSAFKVVTIAAALEEKLTRPDEVFDCQMGSILFNGLRIHDSHPNGLLPVSGILAKSSNVGAIKIASRLGKERFYKYIQGFGFGARTGIELPWETRGLTEPINKWSDVSIAAIAMGQEIGITPLQLVALISTMANDGVQVAPRIVAATPEPQNAPQTVPIVFRPLEQRRVISSYTAAEMRQMMQGVVLHGTGKRALLMGYSSAGKTGTGQKIDPNTKAYSRTKYVATFTGFAPVNNPAITVAVILDSAVGQHQGGEISAPVFQRIAQQVLEYLHVPHDIELPASRELMMAEKSVKDQDLAEGSPDRVGQTLAAEYAGTSSDAANQPETEVGISPEEGKGLLPASLREPEPQPNAQPANPQELTMARPEPSTPVRLPSNGPVVLEVEQGGILVPSFTGRTVRSAVEIAEQNGLDIEAVGSGVATDQSPAAGVHVAAGTTITVKFGR
jgi:membrane peptidoglycan carboxypeptidase